MAGILVILIQIYNACVLKLDRCLYGHRRAPYLWNEEINTTLKDLGFIPSPANACLYKFQSDETKMYILLHVDDFAVADNNSNTRAQVTKILDEKYGIKYLGEVERYTNYQLVRNRVARTITLHQFDYVAELLWLVWHIATLPRQNGLYLDLIYLKWTF